MSGGSTLRRWVHACHAGVAPWVMGVVVAFAVCVLAWPGLKRPWAFHDFVVGTIDVDDDKGRDWRVLVLFLAVAGLTSAAFGFGLRLISRGRRGMMRAGEDLLLVALAPAAWAIAAPGYPVLLAVVLSAVALAESC